MTAPQPDLYYMVTEDKYGAWHTPAWCEGPVSREVCTERLRIARRIWNPGIKAKLRRWQPAREG